MLPPVVEGEASDSLIAAPAVEEELAALCFNHCCVIA